MGQIEEFFVDAHSMKVIENVVCPKRAKIDVSLLVAHNMKVIEHFVCSKEAEIE